MPLQCDRDKAVPGKQRRPCLELAAMRMTHLTQPRQIRLVAVEREAVLGQALALRLELRAGPERHGTCPTHACCDARRPADPNPISSGFPAAPDGQNGIAHRG